MPYKTIDELPDQVKKLTTEQQQTFLGAFNSAIKDGKTEEEAFKIAWAAAQKVKALEKQPRRITGYKALSPGIYRPQTPPKEITTTAEDVQEWVEAVNIKYSIGNPVTLMFTHAEGLAGIECGLLERAWMVGEDAYVDIVVLTDAISKGEIVRTLDQIADGIETGMMATSWEGWQGGYKNDTYTGDRTFNVWPTGYAVLPGSNQPAIPPGVPITADENQDSAGVFLRNVTMAPDGGNSPIERGQEMTEKEIADLKAENVRLKEELAELKKSIAAEDNETSEALVNENTDLKAKVKVFEDAEEAALKTKAKELQKSVLDRTLAANRPDVEKQILAIEDSHLRVQFLTAMDKSLPELKLDDEKLNAGDADDDGSDPKMKIVNAAEKLAKEKSIPFKEALGQIIKG